MASPQFGLVVLTATAIGLQVVWTGARAGMTRSSTLDAALSEKKDTPEYAKLLADHKNATGGDDFPKGGYAVSLSAVAGRGCLRAHPQGLDGVATACVLTAEFTRKSSFTPPSPRTHPRRPFLCISFLPANLPTRSALTITTLKVLQQPSHSTYCVACTTLVSVLRAESPILSVASCTRVGT